MTFAVWLKSQRTETEEFLALCVSQVSWDYLSNVSLHNPNWVDQNIPGQLLNLLPERGTEQEGWKRNRLQTPWSRNFLSELWKHCTDVVKEDLDSWVSVKWSWGFMGSNGNYQPLSEYHKVETHFMTSEILIIQGTAVNFLSWQLRSLNFKAYEHECS